MIEHFVARSTARAASEILDVQANTAIRVYTDAFRGYNALDVSDFHHRRINYSNLFADGRNHINGIENSWNQDKRHMRKFNGIKQDNFY